MTEGSNSASGENAFTPGKVPGGAYNTSPSKQSQVTPTAFAKLNDQDNVADYDDEQGPNELNISESFPINPIPNPNGEANSNI